MGKKFLHKVLDQIISETIMGWGQKIIFTPFGSFSILFPLVEHLPSSYVAQQFIEHCKDVYSVKKNSDIEYIWLLYCYDINKKVRKQGYA